MNQISLPVRHAVASSSWLGVLLTILTIGLFQVAYAAGDAHAVARFLAVNGAAKDTSNPVVTFAQPFVPGDVSATETLQAVTADGHKLPTQIDWKASNPDGSRRHGVITVALPDVKAGQSIPFGLYREKDVSSRNSETAAPKNLDLRIVLRIDGKSYSASFRKLLASGVDRKWLSGGLVNEWHVSGPVTTQQGKPHDRIWVQFYVRRYTASDRTRVAAIVENTWAFKANPRNVTYDAHIFLNGQEIYSQEGLTHTDHARWRKVFWIGGAPDVYVRHDLNYLKATGAIPNYDPALRVRESAVAKLYKEFNDSGHGPMETSIVTRSMGNTGGRRDIGPLPAWTVLRLLTMDPRLVTVDRGVSESAGSWPIHLRDQATGLPVSLEDHPNLSTHPNLLKSKKNPLPEAAYGEYPGKLRVDVSHEPSLAFVPYLLSGDYYFLEELQFWAAMDPLRTSPGYRGFSKGLLHWLQIRGQAWSMRTLGQVAYITPDDNPMKAYWNRQLQNNLAWYNAHYANNANANRLGFLGGEIIYKDDKGRRRGIAPWQDDFFTWTMGYLVALGFDSARPMLEYKARFPVGRMIAPGYCWVSGAIYKLFVRANEHSKPYKTFAEAYHASVPPSTAKTKCGSAAMAATLKNKIKAGSMSGHPGSPQGFPANMQPALAAAVDANAPGADQAWSVFMDRRTKPDYSAYPNWDIVPRDNPR